MCLISGLEAILNYIIIIVNDHINTENVNFFHAMSSAGQFLTLSCNRYFF